MDLSVGLIGSILLGICALPETIRTIQDKRCHLGWGFLFLWYVGEILSLIYGVSLKEFPLILNYSVNVIALTIMVYYKIYGKNNRSIEKQSY